MDQALDDGETRIVSFQYVANDGTVDSAPATVTITVTGVNDVPVASAGSASGSEDDAAITGSVSATDVDGEALSYSLVGGPIDGVTFNSDGTFSVDTIPADQAMDDGESRVVSFQYVANDGSADSAAQTVTVTINGVNDAPVATDASAFGDEDEAAVSGSVSATDVDGEALSYSLVGGPIDGVTFNSDGSYSVDTLPADQAMDDGESRVVTFQYIANDGTADSAAQTVTVTINGVNDAPVAAGASAFGNEDDASVSGSVGATDVDGEALTYSLVGGPIAGVTFNSDGTYSVDTLPADQAMDDGESRVVSFQYIANDGTADSAAQTVTVTINGANDAPVAADASAFGDEDDASVSGSVSATDVDGEALSYSLLGGPIDGVIFNSDGTFSVDTIPADQAMDDGESRVVSFQYIANDGTADSAAQTVTVTIHGVNDAPELTAPAALGYTDTVYDDSFAATGGTLSATDADGEDLSFGIDGGTVTGNSVSFTGSYGTLVLDSITGEYTYTPDDLAIESLGGAATDSFTVTVSDGTASANQTLTVNLTQAGVTETQNADNLSGVYGVAEAFAGLDGNDTYTVDALDTVQEGAGGGTDIIVADFNYTLGANLENLQLTGRAISGTGNGLDNELTGNSGSNVLAGGAGNDRLDGGLGADTLSGGTGDDTYVLDSTGDRVTELAGEGSDLVLSSVGYALAANVENLTLTGSSSLSGSGNALANIITGNAGINLLNGGDGNDTLYGLGGGDTLKGDNGNDVIAGGTGNDNVQGGAGDDSYLIARGEGTDTLTDASGNDVLWFNDATISSEQLWFRQVSSDLEVSVIGTTTKVVVKGWYTAPANQVETIRAGDGMELLASEVQTLVSAMASFATRPAGSTSLTAGEQAALLPVIGANWS